MKFSLICAASLLILLSFSCKSQAEAKEMSSSDMEALEISSSEREAFEATQGEPVVIADEATEYEIVIIDPGYYSWLMGFARPQGYYSQTFLENRNAIYVMNWNQRVLLPSQYPTDLYEWPIDYDPQIDYGYEVNYKLYNYFIYFQRRYNQRLGPFIPRL